MFRRENEGMAGDHPLSAPHPIRPQRPFPSPASPFAAATSIHMPLLCNRCPLANVPPL